MFNLKLRQEFFDENNKGTAIELANNNKTGATQVSAEKFLEITYPSSDLLKALEAIAPDQSRPIVFIGERGRGKSHLMATLYHALSDQTATSNWLGFWAQRLNQPQVGELPLRTGTLVIAESLHRQRVKFLWDILLEKHPHGKYIQGKWATQGANKTDVLPFELILELLENQPVALILDEFQTWFDGLIETTEQPQRTWAFNFIQILSEIASEHPDKLLLVVSVRNGTTDAYQQIHRVNPVQVDFKSPNAEHDRRQLLLHRLFENRLQIDPETIEQAIKHQVTEYIRLYNILPVEQERKHREFIESYPFAPHLLQLLEDQVLVATNAQETRDLIRILADLFKNYGDDTPILTAADFRLDDDKNAIASLLSSVANPSHAALRERAQRNLIAVQQAVSDVKNDIPHLQEIIGSLWLRSIAIENLAGAEPHELQVDITKDKTIDGNSFSYELQQIVENSFNIHQNGSRLIFKEEENPQAKLIATARNDRLFEDGSDKNYLAQEIRYVLGGGDSVAQNYRVTVLPLNWQNEPWKNLEEKDHPDKWDERLPVVVIPENVPHLNEVLGKWTKEHLQKRRNTVRFLLPRTGTANIYLDKELLHLSRMILKAKDWKAAGNEYGKLETKYQTELRTKIGQRFNRLAILRLWNFQEPARCEFSVETINEQGSKTLEAADQVVRESLFIPEDFNEYVAEAARNNSSVSKLFNELREPRPNGQESIAWLGETAISEKILRLCAQGKIAISLGGREYLQINSGETETSAWQRMRGRLGTGRTLDETIILPLQAVPQTQNYTEAIPGAENAGGQGGFQFTPGDGQTTSTGQNAGGIFTPGGNSGNEPFSNTPTSLFTQTEQSETLYAPPTSPLNLLGKTESWGIHAGSKIRNVVLKVDSLNGAQLQKLLRDLPDGLTYELNCQKED